MTTVKHDKKWARVLSAILLLALIGYGGYLRYHDLGFSLYDNEIVTRSIALDTVEHTVKNQGFPLYYLAAKLSLVIGDSERTLRLPSFLAGLLSILALYGLVRQLHSRTAGLVAAALLAFNPFHITHSTFALYYALLMLFTILTLWSLLLVLERGRWHQWLAYTLSAFLGMVTQVCFAPALLMLNVGAAIYLLCARKNRSLKHRLALIVLLFICTGISLGFSVFKFQHETNFFQLASFAAQPLSPVESNGAEATASTIRPSVIAAHQQRPLGGGAAFAGTDGGETRFVLTYYDCLEYLKWFFWSDTPLVWTVLLLVGIWGAVDLLYRIPAAGLPIFFGLFLAPVPFFFLSSSHWYHPRYFAYGLIFSLILVSIGVCVLPRFLSRVLGAPRSLRLWRRVPEAHPRRTLTAANVLYLLFVVAMAIPAVPYINAAYQTYPVAGYLPKGPLEINHTPERDWRNLYRYMARTAKKEDQILFMSPNTEHGPAYAQYYLSHFLPWSEEGKNVDFQFGIPTEERLKNFAAERPEANFWCVGYIKYRYGQQRPILMEAGAQQENFWERNHNNGLALFYIGAPTTTHVANGSFEEKVTMDLPDGAEVDPKTATHGKSSLRLSVPPSDTATTGHYVSFPTAPAGYRLRNNGFEAWSAGLPVGWNLRTADPALVSMVRPGFEGGTSLVLAPSEEDTVVQQSLSIGLAPGRTIELQMMGKSETPNNLHLVVRYQGPGYQREEHVVHPGNGRWVQLHTTIDLPADVDADSISLEVWRMAGGTGDVVVDNLELRVQDLGGRLEPQEPYVLSLTLRTQDLLDNEGSGRNNVGHVRLRWEDSEGVSGTTNLIEINDNQAWRHHSVVVTPGMDFPLDTESLFVEIGIENGTGTIWMDEVQLERGTAPTSFTDSHRLPHDEALAGAELAPLEFDVSWD